MTRFSWLLISVFLGIACSNTMAFAGEAEVIQALSLRHFDEPFDKLEELAGGQDELVAILLKYRTRDEPPFVAIRSERLLLNYADRPDVLEALESDLRNPNYLGLARTIGTALDSVPDAGARMSLAEGVLERSQNDDRFSMFGKMLLESKHVEIKRLAKERLQ